jgi:hypothetical protein
MYLVMYRAYPRQCASGMSPKFMMVKIRLGMQQKLDVTPILKLTIPIGQLSSALELGKPICVLCPKDRDAENELGESMAGLCTRDSGIAADLNSQIDRCNHDANRSDDLPEVGEVIEIHVAEALAEQI